MKELPSVHLMGNTTSQTFGESAVHLTGNSIAHRFWESLAKVLGTCVVHCYSLKSWNGKGNPTFYCTTRGKPFPLTFWR